MKNKLRSNRTWFSQPGGFNQKNKDFKCLHCHNHVSTDPMLSRVNNRNHCPYCLWSRHMDLYKAGDRLAACQAGMKPIGLTLKKTRKKYGGEKDGELMLVHLCIECGQVSINRIAADDDAQTVFETMGSVELDLQTKARLEEAAIIVLGAADIQVVRAQLFGLSWCSFVGEDYLESNEPENNWDLTEKDHLTIANRIDR